MKLIDNSIIDYKTLVNCLVKLGLMIILARISGGYGLVIFAILAIGAMASNRQDNLFFVVMMIITMTMGSSALIPKNSVSFMVMRGTLMLIAIPLAVKIAGRKSPQTIAPLMMIMIYMIYIAATSVQGWCPIISELKVVLFVMIFLAFYGASTVVLQDKRLTVSKIRAMALSIACFFLIGSVLSIPFPAVSMMNAEEMLKNPEITSLFRGLTNHSQCLGPVCAILGTIVFGDLLFGVGKPSNLHYVLLLCVPILIYKTSSRTAMGSMLLGAMVVLFFFMRTRNVRRGWKAKIMNFSILIGVIGALAIVATPSMRKAATAFINKRGDLEESISVANVMSSRQGLVDQCLDNYHRSPVFGNGFQVSETMQGYSVSNITQVLSAPIEKGVMWAAVLEEGGAIGFGIITLFVITAILKLVARKAYIGASAFIVFVIVNFGEFTFFSMSYAGGLFWACVFMGCVLDGYRLRDEKRIVYAHRW